MSPTLSDAALLLQQQARLHLAHQTLMGSPGRESVMTQQRLFRQLIQQIRSKASVSSLTKVSIKETAIPFLITLISTGHSLVSPEPRQSCRTSWVLYP